VPRDLAAAGSCRASGPAARVTAERSRSARLEVAIVSTMPVRDPEAPRSAAARPGAAARHRKRSLAGSASRGKREWAAAVAVWGLVVLVFGWAIAQYGGVQPPAPVGAWLAKATGDLGAWGGAWASPAQIVSAAIASPMEVGYRNPLRGVSGLVPERIDDGVDFAGLGPVHALGDAVVTGATGTNFGWPGGGWITYRLTGGPAAGLVVYVAEDITPAVTVGQRVSSSTVIGTMFDGGDGIETGWAQPTSLSAESELPEAGGIGGSGPFPTRVGVNFDELLQSLGVPAAPNRTQPAFGLLPAGYPASW
jgi:murein DD-endopeptidase MepM/ murein hydrolase activator NlpD